MDRDYLDRFLACADIPEDVRRWVLGLVHAAMSPTERREERDRLLRTAAAIVPGDPWTRARRLHIMAIDLIGAIPVEPDTTTARGLIAAALLLSPGHKPPAVHTIYRIACMTL